VTTVDLNCDIAEGYGVWRIADDDALLTVVSSANVACGFHAGDPGTMRRACVTAVKHGVAIGAQVSYRDLAGFGRRFIDVPPMDLVDDVLYQLAALQGIAAVSGGRMTYVKPHGALYNAIVTHEAQAAAVVEAVRQFDASLAVLGLPGSRWLALAAEAGLETVTEAFADRAYTPEGTLVSRREPGSVLSDPDVVAQRVVRMATEGTVVAIDGSVVETRPRSICVHSDTPGALSLAKSVRSALVAAGVRVESFR
jgi:5-oxoprolinase (ATP-hydrolysing) subunit A